MPHLIRLRGPWTYELSEAEQVQRGEISLPAIWSAFVPADSHGSVTLVRRFGRPTGLEQAPSVWLVVDAGELPGTVFLNGERLGEIAPSSQTARGDVLSRLLPRNELRLEFPELPHGPMITSKSCPDVWLEIESQEGS